MHPYQELCHLLREYSAACAACDDEGALDIAKQIQEASQQLVIVAQKNLPSSQMRLPL